MDNSYKWFAYSAAIFFGFNNISQQKNLFHIRGVSHSSHQFMLSIYLYTCVYMDTQQWLGFLNHISYLFFLFSKQYIILKFVQMKTPFATVA